MESECDGASAKNEIDKPENEASDVNAGDGARPTGEGALKK